MEMSSGEAGLEIGELLVGWWKKGSGLDAKKEIQYQWMDSIGVCRKNGALELLLGTSQILDSVERFVYASQEYASLFCTNILKVRWTAVIRTGGSIIVNI